MSKPLISSYIKYESVFGKDETQVVRTTLWVQEELKDPRNDISLSPKTYRRIEASKDVSARVRCRKYRPNIV